MATLFLAADNFMLPCMSKQLLGMECPGCGLQRAVVFFLKGDFIAAFKMYPAIYPMMLLFGFLIAGRFLRIRFANAITIFLMITSVAFILINFILKFI